MKIPKHLMLFSLFLCCHFLLVAQDAVPVNQDSVYSQLNVDVKAEYPGGDKARIDFIEKKVNGFVPIDNGAPRGTYTVVIICTIDIDGKIISTVPETKLGYGMEEEVIRIIKKLPKPYSPAVKNGVAVKSKMKFPVTFAF
jgi:periplasmic protein TonB